MKKEKDFYQISLKGIIKNKNNEILYVKAVDTGTFAGYYDLPGGRIDTDEFKTPFEKILSREIIEEVGKIKFKIKNKPVAIGRHLIPKEFTAKKEKDIHVLYLFFEVLYLGGKISTSFEHTGFEWLKLSKDKLSKYFKSGILEGMRTYLK